MVHVICTDISGVDAAGYQRLYDLASPERRDRADRYSRRQDAVRCVVGEALLRHVLGTDRFRLERTVDGKLFLPDRPDFFFNLSHSGNWVVIAWGDSEVGVDVERIRMDTNIEGILNRYFSGEEQDYIREDPANSRRRFFQIWTAKESFVKYLGTGLRTPLSSFNVLHPEPGLRIHYRELPGDYGLSLCTTEPEPVFEFLDVRRFL